MPSNTQDENGVFDTDFNISVESLYKRTISYIQSLQSESSVKITPSFKKLIMARTLAKVNYVRTIKGYDNKEIYTQNFTGDYALDIIEFDLSNFAT